MSQLDNVSKNQEAPIEEILLETLPKKSYSLYQKAWHNF